MSERFDAIVIGTGQIAPALCVRLDKEGLKTALIERNLVGGTCVNNGCIPTKTLVASARAAHVARRGAEHGFRAGDIRVDMAAVKRRMDGVVKQSSDGVTSWIAGMKNLTFIRGQARFTGPRTVAVDGRSLEGERVFINVGGRALVPDLPGVGSVPFLTNTNIGLEFAQMYRRFGSRVTVVERAPKLLPREDDDVAAEIRAVLEREGVDIRTGAERMEVKRKGDRVVLGFPARTARRSLKAATCWPARRRAS